MIGIEQCLTKIIEFLKNLQANSRMDSLFFHNGNTPTHRVKVCIDHLNTTRLKPLVTFFIVIF